MNTFSTKEIVLSLVLVIAAVVLLNPFSLFMPTMFQMVATGLLVVFVGLFAGLVVHESISDEREAYHRDRAGRVGYTAGLLVILLGIVVQSFSHTVVDVWLIVALVTMVVLKIVARAYSRRYH